MTTTPTEVNVDDLRRRARRRLIGAIVLALAAAVFVPMLLESDPKPLGEDVAVRIPPVDDGKFVNRLNDKAKNDSAKSAGTAKGDAKADPAKADAPRGEPAPAETGKADGKDAGKEAGREAAAREAAARDTAAATAALNGESPKDVGSAEPPKDGASPAPAARRTLAEAEQKMLGTPAKPPAAASFAAGTGARAPESAPTAPAKAPPAAAAPAAPPVASGTPPGAPATTSADSAPPTFSVQLAAFADDKGANSLANKLKKAGYAAYTEPLTTSRGTLWRVRVGPYATRDEAAAGRDKLKGEGYSGIVAPSK